MIAHFYAYGTIGENDPYFKVFTGEEDPVISSKKVSDFLNQNSAATEIIVHINSRGGSVDEGFAIHDLLTNSGKKITTRVEGQASSIASVVLMAGSVRQISENSTVLVHNPWMDLTLIGGLEADEMIHIGNQMKEAENKILDFYVSKTGVEREAMAAFMKEETAFTADKALELKFATEILQPVKALAFMNFKKENPKNENLMSTIKEMLASALKPINDYLAKNEAETPAAETVAVETPAPTPTDAAPTPTVEEQLAALKAENEELKKKLEAQEAELTEALAEVKTKYESLAKSVKSDHTVQTGQTTFARTQSSQPVNRVEEAKRKYKMQKV